MTPHDPSGDKPSPKSELHNYNRRKLRSLGALKWGPRSSRSEPRAS